MTSETSADAVTIRADGPVAAFMARVLDDPVGQARLAAPIAMDAYIARAVAIAQEYGITLAAADLDDHLRPDPLGIGRFGPAPVTLDRWPGQGWVPARSVPGEAAPAFDWMWVGDTPFADPFYEDTVRRATVLPFNRMFRTRTSLTALVRGAPDRGATVPDGLIYHMSRCGSTLAARMLMAVPGHLVASEPEPLDAVVQWATLSGAPQAEKVAALRAVASALGRTRIAGQRRFFVKLDAWHTLALPLFRAAFPDTPWLFLYRDPVEVLVSHMDQPGIHTAPGVLPPALIGEDFSGATSLADYAARILARICGAVVDFWPLEGGLALAYPDAKSAMARDVPAHFGFRLDASETDALTAAATVNAKSPLDAFAPDAKAKHARAPAELLAAAAAHLAPVIETLDKFRDDGIASLNDRDSWAS